MKHSTLLLCLLFGTASTSGTKSSPASVTPSTSAASPSATKSVSSGEPGTVLVGAGDIASCDDLKGAEATAKLLGNIPGTVFVAGDLAYPDGSDEQFAKCYGPTWGRFKDRTALLRATMSTIATARPATCATLVPWRAILRRHTTAMTLEVGTSLF
jgi:hypothetical protein